MRSRLHLVLPLLFAALVWGCAASPDADGNHAALVGDTDAGGEHDSEDGDDHEHGAEGNERDGWSKPHEVYAFMGVGEGDRVVDLMAGGGYNTLLLADVVGTSGKVIAEGGNEDLRGRVLGGDLAGYSQIEFVDDIYGVADGGADAVLAVRAYHLFPDVPAVLAELHRALAPAGVVGIVEVRLNQEEGHNMQSHRMGEQTVISDMEAAGFEYVGSSDMLRIDDDDYTVFAVEGRTRFMTDRMLLTFKKPE